jgi:Ca2+:H+ antiporter
LRAGLIDVVKATLLGSVLSNLLLVLGCSFFFGGFTSSVINNNTNRQAPNGMRVSLPDRSSSVSQMAFVGEKVQNFSVLSAMVNTSLLLLSCLTLCLVTVFHSEAAFESEKARHDTVLSISRICAVAMMTSYVAYIFFQLVTHREALAEDEGGDDDGDDAVLSIPMALGVMCVVTLLVGFSSELLVESLDEVVTACRINSHFIGIILLPIVGNACEHASAIRFAVMDKPGLSIGIAVGSSTQIALFVVPFSVLMGWGLGQPMDLDFGPLNATVMSISVVVVLSIVVEGTATWLQGYLLMTAYYVVGVLYWHIPEKIHREAIL